MASAPTKSFFFLLLLPLIPSFLVLTNEQGLGNSAFSTAFGEIRQRGPLSDEVSAYTWTSHPFLLAYFFSPACWSEPPVLKEA